MDLMRYRRVVALQVSVNGEDVTLAAPWTHRWMMSGEAKTIFSAAGTDAVSWSAAGSVATDNTTANVWFRSRFDLPTSPEVEAPSHSWPVIATSPPPAPAQLAHALKLPAGSLNKGVAYVNGFELGRYWLKTGSCHGACAPPIKAGFCYMHWKGCDEPTQIYYHIPAAVLRPTGNLVVLFGTPRGMAGIVLCCFHAVALQDHAFSHASSANTHCAVCQRKLRPSEHGIWERWSSWR